MTKMPPCRPSLVRSFLAACAIAAASSPATTFAQSKAKQADVRYEQGKAYYKAGAFDLAIQEFLAGYELDPRAPVLFNVGLIYQDKLQNGPKAIEYFKRYLELGAAATEAVEARARIAGIERQIEAERQAREAEARRKAEEAEAERRRKEEAAAAAEAERRRQAELAQQAPQPPVPAAGELSASTPPPASPPDPERARNLKLVGLVAGGAGVALTGLGIVFGLQHNALRDEIEAATGQWTPELADKDAERRTKGTVAVVSLVAGGLALAGGAVAYFLGWQEQQRVDEAAGPAARWLPSVALAPEGGASLVWVGRF